MVEEYKLPYSGNEINRRLRDVDTKANVLAVTKEEYMAIDAPNANTIYLLTDDEDIDATLTQSGMAADAKVVGEQLSIINQKIDNFDYQSGITSIDDGSGNITLQALYIPLSSSDDNQGNVTIMM